MGKQKTPNQRGNRDDHAGQGAGDTDIEQSGA
jgi:hypothetical protein